MAKRLLILCITMGMLATLAWATGSPEPAKAAGPVKLTMLNHNTEKPERAQFFEDVAAKYKAAHPNVTIEVTKTSFNDVNTQVLTAISSGSPYDLFTTFNMQLWVDKGVPYSITAALNANGGDWKNQIYESVLQAITYPDGNAYFMPLWMDTTPMLYHKEIFSRLNLKAPTNRQEFSEAAEALKKAGTIPFQVHGSMADDLLNVFGWQFAAKYGVKPYDVATGKVPFTDPWFTDSLRTFKDMYDRGYLPPNFWSVGGTEGRTGYSTGKMAIRFGFFWDVDTQKDMGMPYENQGVSAFPNITGQDNVKVYKLLTMTGLMASKAGKNPDVAVDVIKFFTNADNQKDMSYKYFGKEPNGMPAVNKAVKLSDYAMSYINDLSRGVTTPYGIADVSLKYMDTFTAQIPLLMQGKVTVEQVAAEFEKVRTAK
jgi:raffinose/stachyose/melibiose transport system substrate-binding protein